MHCSFSDDATDLMSIIYADHLDVLRLHEDDAIPDMRKMFEHFSAYHHYKQKSEDSEDYTEFCESIYAKQQESNGHGS